MDSVGSLKTRLVGLILFIAGAILVTIAKPGETEKQVIFFKSCAKESLVF